MKLKRILGGLGVIALAAVGTQLVNVQASSAHTPTADITCTTWSIGGTNYDTGMPKNTYSYSLDGATAVTGTFGATFTKSGTFPANTGNHTLVGYVYQNGNPNAQYSKTYDLETTGCATYLPIPAAPVPTPPTCTTAGTATIPNDTATVNWSLSGNVATATAKGALKFVGNVNKVTFTETVLPKLDANSDGCATHVTAVAPVFTNGDCDTAPSLTGASAGTGYIVAVTGSAGFGHHVVVTFTALPNYRLDGKTVYTFDYAAQPDCRTMVSPVNPTVTQATCDRSTGTDSGFAITPGTTESIAYSVDGLVVTATAADGHKLGNLPNGWTMAAGSDTVATFTVLRQDPICPIDVSPVNPTVTQATCDRSTGTDSGFAVTPGITEFIDYTVSNNGLVVTATATDDHHLGNLPGGWTMADGSNTVATFPVTESDPSCPIDVSPVNPTVTQASCDRGTGIDSGFTVTPGVTEFIVYTVSKNQHHVTATAIDDHHFGNLPKHWKMAKNSNTVATFRVRQVDPICPIDVNPVDPTVTQSTCDPSTGIDSGFSVTPGVTEFIDYTVSEDQLVVTATAQGDHHIVLGPNSTWDLQSDTEATYPVTRNEDPICSIDTTSTEPTFAEDVCKGDASTGASITLPSSTGVDYFVDGVLTAAGKHAAVAGSHVTVTAAAQEGYTLTGTTSWTHTFDAVPTCLEIGGEHVVRPPAAHAPAHQPVSAAAHPLASTGVPTMSLLLIGGLLAMLGGGLCLAATIRWGARS
jgi:hypothetical protein